MSDPTHPQDDSGPSGMSPPPPASTSDGNNLSPSPSSSPPAAPGPPPFEENAAPAAADTGQEGMRQSRLLPGMFSLYIPLPLMQHHPRGPSANAASDAPAGNSNNGGGNDARTRFFRALAGMPIGPRPGQAEPLLSQNRTGDVVGGDDEAANGGGDIGDTPPASSSLAASSSLGPGSSPTGERLPSPSLEDLIGEGVRRFFQGLAGSRAPGPLLHPRGDDEPSFQSQPSANERGQAVSDGPPPSAPPLDVIDHRATSPRPSQPRSFSDDRPSSPALGSPEGFPMPPEVLSQMNQMLNGAGGGPGSFLWMPGPALFPQPRRLAPAAPAQGDGSSSTPAPADPSVSTSFTGDGQSAEGHVPTSDTPQNEGAEQRASPFTTFLNSILSQIAFTPPSPSEDGSPGSPDSPSSRQGPFIITITLGGGPMNLPEKQPDPERAAELLSALDTPEPGLVERLDRALRMEEEAAGVKKDEQTGARCSVCMDGLLAVEGDDPKDLSEDEVKSLPCGHAFHEECLRPWLEMHTSCPTCRFDLDPLSTTLRPNRQRSPRPARSSSAPDSEGGSNAASTTASGLTSNAASASRRSHPYSRSPSRSSTPSLAPPSTATSASASGPPTPSALGPDDKPFHLPLPRQTLLSRVLALEDALHLRCSLPTCGHAPTSSRPKSTAHPMVGLVRNVHSDEAALEEGFVVRGCTHRFHGSCLRTAMRVLNGQEEQIDDGGVRVGCLMRGCDGVGTVSASVWAEEDPDDEDEPSTFSKYDMVVDQAIRADSPEVEALLACDESEIRDLDLD